MATKPQIIARIFLDDGHRSNFQSVFRTVGISFSFINGYKDNGDAIFTDNYDAPSTKKGLAKLQIQASAEPAEMKEKGITALNVFDICMDAREPKFAQVEEFYKSAKHLKRTISKLDSDHYNFGDYIKAALKVSGACGVWFEHDSENSGKHRNTHYDVDQIDELLTKAVDIIKYW